MKSKADLNNLSGKQPCETEHHYLLRTIGETNKIIDETNQILLETAEKLREPRERVKAIKKEVGISNCGTCDSRPECLLKRFTTERFRSKWCPYAPFPSVSFSEKIPTIQIPEGVLQWEDRLSAFIYDANEECLLTAPNDYTCLTLNDFTIINPQ